MIQPTVLNEMHKYLNELDKDCLEDTLFKMSQQIDDKAKLITESVWNEIMEPNLAHPHLNVDGKVSLVNASDYPRLVYDSVRKTFHVQDEKWALLGSLADKVCSES